MTKDDIVQITRDDFMALLGCMGMMSSLIGAMYLENSREELGMVFTGQMVTALIEKYGTDEDRESLREAFHNATLEATPVTENPN